MQSWTRSSRSLYGRSSTLPPTSILSPLRNLAILVLSCSLSPNLKRSSSICCLYSSALILPCLSLWSLSITPFYSRRGDVPLPKGNFQVIPILHWRIPMNPSFPNKGSPPIEGIPLEAKGSQRNLPFLTYMMTSKGLLNLHFPI